MGKRSVVPLKVREVIRKIDNAVWRLLRTSGDHRVFRSPDGRLSVVSGRLADDVRRGMYKAILKQSGIEEDKT
ncbi:MAG: type II toxin-antitoxin system HicA family toxin [Bryobacterales bacterium]|nr:type II toxin-antitoxin system HicA family toxin [Bryobacterales bacterium]